MANQIVTLKDDNNNPTFPIAGGMAEDSITTQMLKDGSVTSDKIDWATINQTITDTSGRTGIYFDDGTLIAYRNVTGTADITTAWGSLYRGQILSSGTGTSFTPSTGTDFIEKPIVSIRVGATSATTFMVASWTNSDPVVSSSTGRWGLPTGSTALVRPTSASSVPFSVDIIAIGRWK